MKANKFPKKRYVEVTVRPYKVRRYPFKVKELTFTVCRKNAVSAVEMLMAYMGYGASQYYILSAKEISNPYKT